MQVAAEEFRVHLNQLVAFAAALVSGISVQPSLSNRRRDANTVLEEMLEISLDDSEKGPGYFWERKDNAAADKKRRTVRRNKMRLNALKEHTVGTVKWEALEDWKRIWNDCVENSVKIEEEACEVVGNCLDQTKGLGQSIISDSGRKDAVKVMAEAVLRATWDKWISRDTAVGSISRIVSERTGARVVLGNTDLGLRLGDTSLAKEAARVCDWAIKNMFLGDWSETMQDRFKALTRAAEALEEMLEELRLRPILLRTRCELCPA
jgi:hypothetical protein